MSWAIASDGVRLYYEESGRGPPILFLHEFAGDPRAWEPQVRFFSRSYRCVTFAARGYPPSDVPERGEDYSQDIACTDALTVLDTLKLAQAHLVGHSMCAYTALHIGSRQPQRCISVAAIGCGWGSKPDEREESARLCTEIAEMFAHEPITSAAAKYARFPMRATFEAKDPDGFARFEAMLAEHSAIGSALTMLNVQRKRPTLWDMRPQLEQFSLPLLVIVGDEDQPCLDGSRFLENTVPDARLIVVAHSGHTLTLEEPDAVNSALSEFFSSLASGSVNARRTTA
jgi:pimeloyl-ACP methyl ester carboxylesterase